MKTLTKEQFDSHLAMEHSVSPISTYLKEIVYGGIDGIVTTFAVVAGFSGAMVSGFDPTLSTITVLLFGFANLFADATSMGLGNFLSVQAEQDVYRKERKKEMHEIEQNPEYEKAETMHMLTEKGFTSSQAQDLTTIFATNKEYWTEFMMQDELKMQNPLGDKPLLTAFVTALSFIIFGLIPLIPYIVLQSYGANPFFVSTFFTLVALVLLGLLRWKVTGQHFMRSVVETVLIGGISAGVAYAVGTLFRM